MHELTCPSCGTPSQFNLADKLLLCQVCSTSFLLDTTNGRKEIYSDHYIVPNTTDNQTVKETVMEWLRRMHHKPGAVDKEFFVIEINGQSLPFWVTSLDVHTVWKGMVKRQSKPVLNFTPGAEYLIEKGQFRRTYRWAICARANLCEYWGLTRLHEPQEQIEVEWDGFPLDSTFSRGRLEEAKVDKPVYDMREFFEYKYANGLPILGVQIDEGEALRRAKHHAELYHYKLAKLNADFLVDIRTEHEIAGVQLVHLPFWHVTYQYRPRTALRHLYKSKNKHVLLEGCGKGILKSELAIVRKDKVWVNTIVCGFASVILLLLGMIWHPSFFIISGFTIVMAIISGIVASIKKANEMDEALQQSNIKTVFDAGTAQPKVGPAGG